MILRFLRWVLLYVPQLTGLFRWFFTWLALRFVAGFLGLRGQALVFMEEDEARSIRGNRILGPVCLDCALGGTPTPASDSGAVGLVTRDDAMDEIIDGVLIVRACDRHINGKIDRVMTRLTRP